MIEHNTHVYMYHNTQYAIGIKIDHLDAIKINLKDSDKHHGGPMVPVPHVDVCWDRAHELQQILRVIRSWFL